KELNADRSALGDVRAFCTPFQVFASDAGVRESLYLKASSFEGLKQDMPVICPAGLVGKLNRTGVAGASVQLVSDPGFRIQAALARFVNNGDRPEFQLLKVQPFVLQGLGGGVMGARFINATELKRVDARPGDWVLVQDPDLPQQLAGARIGQLVQIA